jgi:hypothetical protein
MTELAIDVLRANYEERTAPTPTATEETLALAKGEVPEVPFKVGTKLHTSFGYDMTINDFAVIVEVSKTGKTVLCRMVKKSTNGLEHGPCGGGKASAGDEMHGEKFRLHVREWNSGVYFVGSYPFCGNSKRKGTFSVAKGEYYENRWD